MTRRAVLVVGLLLALAASSDARAQRVLHRVRFGETMATISKRYYGNKSYAQLLRLANGMTTDSRGGKLTPGTHVRVPTAWMFRARRNTSLLAVAARYLGDRRRWPALAMLNKLRGRRKRVRAGKQLLIPFTLPYTVENDATFAELSQRFYGAKKYGGLIASFNFIKATSPSRGNQIEIPLGSPRILPAVLEQLTNERVLGISAEVDQQERARLQEANALLRRGEYWEVPLRLLQLVARHVPADSHIAEVFKLLAVAYVAVGQRELAVKSFREALLRAPGLTLNVVTTSPRVMRAFVDAKAQHKGSP